MKLEKENLWGYIPGRQKKRPAKGFSGKDCQRCRSCSTKGAFPVFYVGKRRQLAKSRFG